MSLAELLTDDLQVWQSVETGRDGFNQPITNLQLVDVVRGRVFSLSTFEQRFSVEGTRAVVKRYRAIVEHRAELTLTERSTIVGDEGVYDVLEVNVARAYSAHHHVELQLEKVS